MVNDKIIKRSYINYKTVDFRIEPFIKESMLIAVSDMIGIALFECIAIFIKVIGTEGDFDNIIFFAIPVFIAIFALFLEHRALIQAMVDKFKNDYITEIVNADWCFTPEYFLGGDRYWHSRVCLCYPKDMDVDRYKIKVRNIYGEKKKIRSVMSSRRCFRFIVFDEHQIEYLKVTYLKRSKILLLVELVEEIDKRMSLKKRKEIVKALNFINNTL